MFVRLGIKALTGTNTLAYYENPYYESCRFSLNYEYVIFYSIGPKNGTTLNYWYWYIDTFPIMVSGCLVNTQWHSTIFIEKVILPQME